jgi:hypothetical protein
MIFRRKLKMLKKFMAILLIIVLLGFPLSANAVVVTAPTLGAMGEVLL